MTSRKIASPLSSQTEQQKSLEILPKELRQTHEAILSALSARRYHFDIERTASSVHEAGHAVIAAVLRVPFSYVTIKPNAKDNSGGHVSFPSTTKLQLFRWTKRGKGDVFIQRSEGEVNAAILKADYKRALVVVAARAVVERNYGDIAPGQYTGDERNLHDIFFRHHGLARLGEYELWHSSLLKKANELVATPYIVESIWDVVALLCQKTTLQAKQVRDVVRLERLLSSTVDPQATLTHSAALEPIEVQP